MADPTKVIRFPNKKKLHLVWSSPSPEDSGETAQKPENAYRQPGEATIATPGEADDGPTAPAKTD